MMYSFTNLKDPQRTLPGIAERVLIALVDWFEPGGIKTPGAWAAPGDEVKIYDDHIFKPGLGFVTYLLAPDKNSYEAKTIGDTGFNKFANELKLLVPGSYALQHEEISNLLGQPCIILVKDSDCPGHWYQVGTECVPARFATEFTTGTTKEGNKAYLLTATNTAEKVYEYQGDITYTGEYPHIIARITGSTLPNGSGGYIATVDGSTSEGWGTVLTYTWEVHYITVAGGPGSPPVIYTLPGHTQLETFNTNDLPDWLDVTFKVVLTISNGTSSDTTLYSDPDDEKPYEITV